MFDATLSMSPPTLGIILPGCADPASAQIESRAGQVCCARHVTWHGCRHPQTAERGETGIARLVDHVSRLVTAHVSPEGQVIATDERHDALSYTSISATEAQMRVG